MLQARRGQPELRLSYIQYNLYLSFIEIKLSEIIYCVYGYIS